MDFDLGRFRLDFVSFCLDMSTKEPTTEVPLPPDESQEIVQATQSTSGNLSGGLRPCLNQSSSSGNTEESLAAYADHTLGVLASMDPSLDIFFLPAPENAPKPGRDTIESPKFSESLLHERERTEHLQVSEQLQETSGGVSSKSGPWDRSTDNLTTDTSEVEELYDIMGAEGIQKRPTSTITYCDLLFAAEDAGGYDKSRVKQTPTGLVVKEPKLPEQFSANGQAVLRKHFSQSKPVTLPKGHTTVSFSEPQIHAVLKTISDETVKLSVRVMRSLVLHAVDGDRKQTPRQFRKSMIRGATI